MKWLFFTILLFVSFNSAQAQQPDIKFNELSFKKQFPEKSYAIQPKKELTAPTVFLPQPASHTWKLNIGPGPRLQNDFIFSACGNYDNKWSFIYDRKNDPNALNLGTELAIGASVYTFLAILGGATGGGSW